MKRTTTRRRREMIGFLHDNRRLFPFAGLFLLGVGIGVTAYVTAADGVRENLGALLPVAGVSGGFNACLSAFGSACFSTAVWLAALFLLGLWACGAPFILAVPLLHGVGLGLTEAYYYAAGSKGLLPVIAVVMPTGLLTGAVLITAATESLRLSARLSRQLLPESGGGLWAQFRLYCLRFLLFLLAAAGAGIVSVFLRAVFCRWLE